MEIRQFKKRQNFHAYFRANPPKFPDAKITRYTVLLPITFIFKTKKDVSLSEVFALFNWGSLGYISGICSTNSGLSMMNISSRYREVSLNVSTTVIPALQVLSRAFISGVSIQAGHNYAIFFWASGLTYGFKGPLNIPWYTILLIIFVSLRIKTCSLCRMELVA